MAGAPRNSSLFRGRNCTGGARQGCLAGVSGTGVAGPQRANGVSAGRGCCAMAPQCATAAVPCRAPIRQSDVARAPVGGHVPPRIVARHEPRDPVSDTRLQKPVNPRFLPNDMPN